MQEPCRLLLSKKNLTLKSCAEHRLFILLSHKLTWIASFHYNLETLVAEHQTILGFATARHDGGRSGDNWKNEHLRSSSSGEITTASIKRSTFYRQDDRPVAQTTPVSKKFLVVGTKMATVKCCGSRLLLYRQVWNHVAFGHVWREPTSHGKRLNTQASSCWPMCLLAWEELGLNSKSSCLRNIT